jgi:hypothetical protein
MLLLSSLVFTLSLAPDILTLILLIFFLLIFFLLIFYLLIFFLLIFYLLILLLVIFVLLIFYLLILLLVVLCSDGSPSSCVWVLPGRESPHRTHAPARCPSARPTRI